MPRTSSPSQNTFLDTIATRFDGIHSNFVLGNAQAQGWPIVYCSDGFCELTGFGRGQVMARGSGCRFLYGAETSDAKTAKISEALEQKRELKEEMRFYRKNGTAFWCLLDIVPIKNEKGDVVLFLVSHKDISKEKQAQEARLQRENGDSPTKNSDDESDDDDDGDGLEVNHEGLPENYNYGRRRSRAVLYHISGQLNKQNKAKSKLQQLNRLASQMPEYKVQELKKSQFIIVHYGIFKIGWDWLILLCTFYIAIMVPFNAAFREGRNKDFMYVDAAVEVLFAVDIVLNFRTTFLNKSGQVVYESRLIAINYIRGWFLLDLLAAIPFDLLYAFSVETATRVHLLKVARLLRLARLLQKLERYNQYSILVLALLMCMFALLAHWLACIWYAIGKAELDENHRGWTAGWLYELSERLDRVMTNKTHNVPENMTSYITALYFTCSSLTSVGFGNVSANTNIEKIFSVCAMLVGAIMHAVVFGNVTTIIQRMYARRATFHSKTKDLKDFFRIHHFPKTLKHRMRDYFQAMWSINNGIDIRQILLDFPEEMRGEIGLHLHGEILSLPIFQSAPPGCLKSVALQTDRLVCGPGEFILRKGDAINCLYYVCSGSMEVLKDEQVVAILGKGDIFGSDVDFDDPISISGCDVRSLAYCELLCIQVKGLVDALLLYPDFAETFTNDLPNDLTYNLREGHEDVSDDESSTAAPVITLPSISEDEEEEEDADKDNNNDEEMTSKERLRGGGVTPSTAGGEDDDEEEHRGGQFSPLLLHPGRSEHGSMTASDFLTSRGRLPNGHIATGLRDEVPHPAPSVPPIPSTAHAPPLHTSPSVNAGRRSSLSSTTASSLALRRTSSGISSRLAHRRNRTDKLKPCRTLPTLNSVSTERSIEQVMVHTLQMELEGTRDTVIGLERRLDDLHEDLSSISRNVDSLLRLVSQSPNPMYLSSHSLQPSYYNQSPSPNATNLYGPPSFYFSQSTVGDARDLSSGQSNSSPAPESWSGGPMGSSGAFPPRADQFLSPFQTPSRNLASPSPLASPRVNFSPSPMSSHLPSFFAKHVTSNNSSNNNTGTTVNSNVSNNTGGSNNNNNINNNNAASSTTNAPCFDNNNIASVAPDSNATASAVTGTSTSNTACPTGTTLVPNAQQQQQQINGDVCDKNDESCDASSCLAHSQASARDMKERAPSSCSLRGSTHSLAANPMPSSPSSLSTNAALGINAHPEHYRQGEETSTMGACLRATPSPPMIRGKSPPRPNKLSPLLPRRVRLSSYSSNNSSASPRNAAFEIPHIDTTLHLHSNNSGSNNSIFLGDRNHHNNHWQPIPRSHSDNSSSHFLAIPKTSASSSMSSVNSATLKACEPFTSEYYHLTQLEPCDAAFGHCQKAQELRNETSPVNFSKDDDYEHSSPSSPKAFSSAVIRTISSGRLSAASQNGNSNNDLSTSYVDNLRLEKDRKSLPKEASTENIVLKDSPTSVTSTSSLSSPEVHQKSPPASGPAKSRSSSKRGKKPRPRSTPSSSSSSSTSGSQKDKAASPSAGVTEPQVPKSRSYNERIVAPLSKSESISDEIEDSTHL